MDSPEDVAAGTVPGVRRAAVRKLKVCQPAPFHARLYNIPLHGRVEKILCEETRL